MGKNEKTPITVNDKEYFVEDLDDQQQVMINHINDLDRKLASARFNVDQLALSAARAFVKPVGSDLWRELRKSPMRITKKCLLILL
jgi:hypothetical protein